MGEHDSEVRTVRYPLGSPDAIIAGSDRRVFVLADPACPDEHVEALEMAARAMVAGQRPAECLTPPGGLNLSGRIPEQLPGIVRQECGLPRG